MSRWANPDTSASARRGSPSRSPPTYAATPRNHSAPRWPARMPAHSCAASRPPKSVTARIAQRATGSSCATRLPITLHWLASLRCLVEVRREPFAVGTKANASAYVHRRAARPPVSPLPSSPKWTIPRQADHLAKRARAALGACGRSLALPGCHTLIAARPRRTLHFPIAGHRFTAVQSNKVYLPRGGVVHHRSVAPRQINAIR